MVQEMQEKDDAALREQVIRMAREAGLYHFYDSEGHCDGITDARLVTEDKERDDDRMIEMLAPFAALAAKRAVSNIDPASSMSYQEGYAAGAAAERERIIAQNAPEIEKINEHIKALEEAVAAEREECAKVCEEHWHIDGEHTAYEFARVIRARGEK